MNKSTTLCVLIGAKESMSSTRSESRMQARKHSTVLHKTVILGCIAVLIGWNWVLRKDMSWPVGLISLNCGGRFVACWSAARSKVDFRDHFVQLPCTSNTIGYCPCLDTTLAVFKILFQILWLITESLFYQEWIRVWGIIYLLTATLAEWFSGGFHFVDPLSIPLSDHDTHWWSTFLQGIGSNQFWHLPETCFEPDTSV